MRKQNNHTRRILIILFLAGLSTFMSCRTSILAPMPSAQSFTADQEELMKADTLGGFVFLPDSRVKVRSIHDSDSLHIEVRTADTLSLWSMLINGVSVFVDPSAGKAARFGIAFPAARAEMLRRQEEIFRQSQNENDTVPATLRLDPVIWVDAIRMRDAVVTDNRGTRFADRSIASVTLDDNGELVYQVRFSFSQLGITEEDHKRISIGVVSQLHQAQLAAPGGGGVATRPNITERERQQRQMQQQRTPRFRLIPINSWMAFLIHEETDSPNGGGGKEAIKKQDDIYR